MSKKIQTVVSDDLYDEITEAMKKKKYSDAAEFLRQCVREYLERLAMQPEAA